MLSHKISPSYSSFVTNNIKVLSLEKTLDQSILAFKELLVDFDNLHIDSEKYKTQLIKQKEVCESKNCSGANDLKKVIETKDNIIQLVASTLTKLNETKNWKVLDEVFKIIFGDHNKIQYEDKKPPKVKEELISPKKEFHSSLEEISFEDESVLEIEGTPTGRTSPIIGMKKMKTSMVSAVERDKKKCPDGWPTSENKAIKLIFPTPSRSKQNSRLMQSRLNVVRTKPKVVIDITNSPEFSGGNRFKETESPVSPLIKKESIENDDTILPSPTSGQTNFTMFKSPMKFKKPALSLISKSERIKKRFCNENLDNNNIETKNIEEEDTKKKKNIIKNNNSITYTQDESINILQPNRVIIKKKSPVKREHNDTTYCETQASESLLQHIDKIEHLQNNMSPTKPPLTENINVTNMSDDEELQSSISLLQRDAKVNRVPVDDKRQIKDLNVDYEERTPRTRAEKRQQPGWACEKCINFFGELYKDDPEMMKKKIDECSHHRGITNPERPKTPPGYWNPRWHVPDDTEEFNRKNNA